MKILVVSDTHGKHYNFEDAVKKEKPHKVFHLGDSEGFQQEIMDIAGCPVEFVAGNCDSYSGLPAFLVMSVGKHVVMLTHGHHYQVRSGLLTLRNAAREKGADIVLYGHTHVPDIDYNLGITCANPGSISYPRQTPRDYTYMILDVDKEGEVHISIHALD
ncbi:MAG: metallophosphoesterase [Pseudobutyrivibrio sp.]|nr:metallophosphoesterase [Pseudobutyrivibrio sp.]